MQVRLDMTILLMQKQVNYNTFRIRIQRSCWVHIPTVKLKIMSYEEWLEKYVDMPE